MGGFNLPPGCSVADIDRAMGLDSPCENCLCWPDKDCQCEECPICGFYGDPNCYTKGHVVSWSTCSSFVGKKIEPRGWSYDGTRFRMTLHPEIAKGRIGRQKLFDIEVMLNLQWEELYAREMDEGNEVERISDKWR